MSRLEGILRAIPAVYGDLVDASLPARTGEPPASKDPREHPAPGNLAVMDHRNKLVRGLRWWVDAVRDPGEWTQVGHDVELMTRWLADHLHVMAEEDHAELQANLQSWLNRAWAMLDRAPVDPSDNPMDRLPLGAWEQTVRVADAAQVLGCTVRTIQRRVPVELRPDGKVKLYDALPRCERCDLRVGADCVCAL